MSLIQIWTKRLSNRVQTLREKVWENHADTHAEKVTIVLMDNVSHMEDVQKFPVEKDIDA